MYLLASMGYAALALTNIFDKYFVERKLSPAVLTMLSTVTVLPIFLTLGWGAGFLRGVDGYALAMLSGAAFTGALYAMFRGFERTEISHSAPLTGALTAVSVIVLNQFVAPEVLGLKIWLGIVLLLSASLLIAFERRERGVVLSRSMLWLVLAGALYGLSHVTAKMLYTRYDFFTGLVWSRGMMALAGCVVLLFKKVRLDLRGVLHRQKIPAASQTHPLLVIFNLVLGVLGVVLVQAASAEGSVVIVNALQSLQYILIIVFVWCSSRFFPRFTREFYTRGEVVQEACALLALVFGFFLVL